MTNQQTPPTPEEAVKLLREALTAMIERYPYKADQEDKPKTFGCHHFSETCQLCEPLVTSWKAARLAKTALAETATLSTAAPQPPASTVPEGFELVSKAWADMARKTSCQNFVDAVAALPPDTGFVGASAISIGDDAEFIRLMAEYYNTSATFRVGVRDRIIAYITRWADSRPVAATDKAAKLYYEHEFKSICAALCRHISAVSAQH